MADSLSTFASNYSFNVTSITKAMVGAAVIASAPALLAQPAPATHSCVVIQEIRVEQPVLARGDQCDTQLSPASTYKIPHALIALETGVVTLESIEKWDGRKYARQPKWNQDHTVISALRPSVLWLFQRIAPRIGAARAAQWLEKFDYGNHNVSGPIEQYWVNGRLQVSAPQQVAFLRKFFGGTLPVQQRYRDAVRNGLRQQTGTVENSLGVHRLEGDWRGTTLFSKTGAATTPNYRVSWLVGMLQSGERQHVFASAVWKAQGDVDTLEASRLAAAAFVDAGLLPPGR
jgi:beta-lactamase class D